ncbi:hypothetical protein U5801_25750 [Lamprobacter modestohalophilus]|uniref:hypothetical protein n=1 Tax=Lamprobacter modestohalophilus TaxID=1064514 RepID=UPI002ADED6F7|nr:hypothetical protein [Lamprobacter modestohalophilus]MEA1053186.1 hypothetical protein [Lamprobacter modestohalophilus]
MRETASAVRGANDDQATGRQLQKGSKAKVVQLDQCRAERLDESVSAVRHRLSELQRARVQAELSAGRLMRELAALQCELRDCRARMIQGGVID